MRVMTRWAGQRWACALAAAMTLTAAAASGEAATVTLGEIPIYSLNDGARLEYVDYERQTTHYFKNLEIIGQHKLLTGPHAGTIFVFTSERLWDRLRDKTKNPQDMVLLGKVEKLNGHAMHGGQIPVKVSDLLTYRSLTGGGGTGTSGGQVLVTSGTMTTPSFGDLPLPPITLPPASLIPTPPPQVPQQSVGQIVGYYGNNPSAVINANPSYTPPVILPPGSLIGNQGGTAPQTNLIVSNAFVQRGTPTQTQSSLLSTVSVPEPSVLGAAGLLIATLGRYRRQ